MKGGITVADTFNKVNHFVEETHGKIDKVFMHEDGKQRDNKVVKEYLKFLAAFEVVEALPPDFNSIRVDLELSIS